MATEQRSAEMAHLASLYTVRGEAEVDEFLRESPQVLSVLLDAHTQICRVFGRDTPITLEVVDDPEIESYTLLWALIQVDMEADEAADKLDVLGKDWWYSAVRPVGDHFGIDVDFV